MVWRREKRWSKTSEPTAALNHELWLPVETDEKLIDLVSPDLWEVGDPESQLQQSNISIFLEEPNSWEKLRFRLGLLVARPWEALRQAVRREIDEGAGFVWASVVFGLGCILYFNLPREPLPWALPVLTTVCLLAFTKIGRGHWTWGMFIGFSLLAGGASVGQLRTTLVDTPMLTRSVVAQVHGLVVKAEHRSNGSIRYTIDVSPSDLDKRTGITARGKIIKPLKIRATARKGGPVVAVGQWIEGRARLGPPPGPSFPGAYDFSFQSWFNGIGGSGFFYGKPTLVEKPTASSSSWTLVIAKTRARISGVIRQALPGRGGALASALIVGDRSGIDRETSEALRRSGLAHILAISGLHMALVALTLIYLIRGIFACFPAVSLYYPVKKWAALLALFGASIYLLLSGANVSTQRAYIMVGIMLLAMVFDRRALTMRNVALAAFIVLAIAPEAVMMPGFQMSFAAVAALVATYEVISRRRRNKNLRVRNGAFGAVSSFLVRDIGGLALTSLVAGIATGLFAAYHFYRIAPFGLLANLLAMPLVSLAVMPLALLSVLAMPFGLETISLSLMAVVMEWVVGIAEWVAQLEPGGNTGFVPVPAFICGVIALLFATLFRTKLKVLAIPFLILAVFFGGQKSFPDALILESGRQVGVLMSPGGLSLLRPNGDKFSTNMWRNAFAPGGEKHPKTRRGQAGSAFQCDSMGCAARVKGVNIVQLKSTSRMDEDCLLADVLVIPYFMPNACSSLPKNQRPKILDRGSLSRYGAHAVTIVMTPNGKQEVKLTAAYGGSPRPWNKHRLGKE